MYNGIGLETARGSGTNGYVQRNLSTIRKHSDRVDYKSEEELKKLEAQFNRKPNRDILEHDRKRQVEVKCMEMQDLMEEQGFTEDEIDAKVTQFRKLLLEKAAVSDSVTVLTDDFGRPIATETHQIALATEEKNARWREAFGIEARDDEKKAFGEEMEKRWEKEEIIVVEDASRKKEKKKKHNRREPSEERDDKKKHRREPSEERDDKKKHRREPSEERDDKKKHRREPSEERYDKKKHRREASEVEERDDKKKHRKRRSRTKSPQSPPKKDRHRRSRSPPRSPKNRRHDDSPKRGGRRKSSSPDGRSRKKR